MGGDVQKDFKLIIDNEEINDAPAAETISKEELQRWPLLAFQSAVFFK